MHRYLAVLLVLTMVVSFAGCNAAAVGVIGSADGPTSIVVTGDNSGDNDDLPEYLEAAKVVFESAVDESAVVIDEIVAAKVDYFEPTDEQMEQLRDVFAAKGYPVNYHTFDMPNSDKVVAFYDDVEAGKDSTLEVVNLYNWGIVDEILVAKNGKIKSGSVVYDFSENEDEEVYSEILPPTTVIENMRITENGYFVYNTVDEYEIPFYYVYRVVPLGEERLALTKKYLSGLSYMDRDILTENWDENALEALSFSVVLEQLHYKAYGTSAFDSHPLLYSSHWTAEDIVEDVMMGYLPITKDQLRSFMTYNPEEKVYEYEYQTDMRATAATPEVYDFVKNADGSITLEVHAVNRMFGDDNEGTSYLTVMDNPDGTFKYLSNAVN